MSLTSKISEFVHFPSTFLRRLLWQPVNARLANGGNKLAKGTPAEEAAHNKKKAEAVRRSKMGPQHSFTGSSSGMSIVVASAVHLLLLFCLAGAPASRAAARCLADAMACALCGSAPCCAGCTGPVLKCG